MCGLILIPVFLFLFPGCAIFAVGSYSFWTNGRNYRKVQCTLGVIVGHYYLAMLVFWIILTAG